MTLIAVTLLCVAFLWSLHTNPDLFSPAKFFLFSFLAFHAGMALEKPSFELWLLVGLVFVVGLATVLLESLRSPHSAPIAHRASLVTPDDSFFVWIWVLSLPGVLSQLYLIQLFGGIEGYINVIGFRVIEWRGLGWAKTMIVTLIAFNMIYFCVGLTRPRSRRWWLAYGVHFLMLLIIGLLSGSRSGVLNVVAMQLFAYHYLKRRVSIRRAASIAGMLIALALVLGIARDGLKIDDGELRSGLDAQDLPSRVPTIFYGVESLEILLAASQLRLAYGSTFASLLTNAVPRAWWPDKPETGGVYFTKEYTGDAWDGASNLTPTFLGEWVINFGWVAGLSMFVLTYPALMYGVVMLYRRTQARLRRWPGPHSALDFVVYLFTMWAIVALMIGEVTSVLLNLALTQLVPVAVARLVVPRQRTT